MSGEPVNKKSVPAVDIVSVTKKFGNVLGVDDVSFSVFHGKFLTMLGPSGSGKSTLLRMIAGFLQPSSGLIYLNGQPAGTTPAYRRSIGMVFQKLALFPNMNVEQNVAYPLKMRGFPRRDIAETVEKYLTLVRLPGYGRRRIHELSGGQQQRVAIARALVFKPDLLLLDEPLAALDKKLREEMQLEFRRIQQELGVTTINVTHDQREALVMSDEIVVMNDARLQQKAAPVETYRQPANQFVAGFLGLTNFLSGAVLGHLEGRARVAVGNTVLVGRCGFDAVAGARVDCAIRAEQVRIGDDLRELETVLPATVVSTLFEGDRLIYALRCAELGDAVLQVVDHDPGEHRVFTQRDSLQIGWNARDLMIFPHA
jgi:putative spermidine/putrescine transport system ATP-binding protein